MIVVAEMKSKARQIKNDRADNITAWKLTSPAVMEIWYCTSRNELEEANYLDANRAVAIASWLRLGH
jgi:hypothetical protein